VADIARNPTNHVGAIFALATPSVYAPRLSQAPSAWTLSLLYGRGGFDGPGRIAFDSRGRIWVTNNFQPPGTGPGLGLISLSPSGQPINGSPVHGGGLQGAWWGIAIDQRDRVWVSSFVGSDTDASFSAPTFQGGHAVSLFSPGGAALSPSGGFSQGGIRAPQGIAVDQHGNVWIANHGNSTVTEYPHGDPSRAKVITGGGLSKPFAIEVDAHGNVWVGDNALTTLPGGLTEIDQSGHATGPIAGPLASPQGIAIDHEGYIWVTQSGRSTVARINPAAAHPVAQNFPANSLNGTWGIAVDGEDNVWATSFFGQTLTEFCGTERRHCPSGAQTGTQISPAKTGFSNGGLEHLTSVQVDQSGDVWVANNWRTITPPTGGDGLVEFIGLAGPVRTPLIGPPQAP
jgi:DNA-binding beta-propeller fold protein YncE